LLFDIDLALDADSNLKMLAFVLAKRGVKAVMVGNGQLALDAIRANPNRFDLIFMDLIMPIMVVLFA
jgi:CheY-like chemotaxis protein